MSRAHQAVWPAVALSLFIGGLFGGYYAYRWRISGDTQFQELAENILGRSTGSPAWPERTRANRRNASAVDLGSAPDAGLDAGPLLPELPPSVDGFQVREGKWEDLVYLEVIIGDATFSDRLPTIVMLHGRGGRAWVPGGPFLELSHPVRVLVPQAAQPLGAGFAWLQVYVGQGLVNRLSATLFEAASHVAQMVRELSEDIPIRGRPIVTGFSQGGIMTLTMALYHDDVVGEALPMACWLPPPLEPAYQRWDLDYPPIHAMHGDADPTIPPRPTTEMFSRLEEHGFEITFETFEGAVHEMNEPMNLLYHEWLDAAVCRTMWDDECAASATHRADVLRGLVEPIEAVVDSGLDAGVIGMDGAIEGGLDDALDGSTGNDGNDGNDGVDADQDESPDAGPDSGPVPPQLSEGLLRGPSLLPSLELDPSIENWSLEHLRINADAPQENVLEGIEEQDLSGQQPTEPSLGLEELQLDPSLTP